MFTLYPRVKAGETTNRFSNIGLLSKNIAEDADSIKQLHKPFKQASSVLSVTAFER